MGFQVIPASVPASREDWSRARDAPASELPKLNEAQEREVQEFSLDIDEYRRLRVLLRKYVLQRQNRQGHFFGNFILEAIRPAGKYVSLAAVSRKGTPQGWKVTIQHEQRGIVEFQCPLEVVEALSEGLATTEQTEGLRSDILAELDQAGFLEAAS